MRKGYYAANVASGVYYYDSIICGQDIEIMNPRDFIESLDTLSDTETIYTFLDVSEYETYDEIKETYGIN